MNEYMELLRYCRAESELCALRVSGSKTAAANIAKCKFFMVFEV